MIGPPRCDARSASLGGVDLGDLRELLDPFLVEVVEAIGHLLRQFLPERALLRLLGQYMAPAVGRGDEPGVIGSRARVIRQDRLPGDPLVGTYSLTVVTSFFSAVTQVN